MKEPVNKSSVKKLSEISLRKTGDPFIDNGTLVIQTLKREFPNKSLFELIEFVIDVYIQKWNQKLHAIFHTNSKLLNPSTPGKHKELTLQYFEDLIFESDNDVSITGYCKTCGKSGMLYENSRSFFPLSGSGAFVNFHHAHESGSYLCNECSIKLFFVPLGVLQLGGNIGLLHVQSDLSEQFIMRRIIQENLNKIARNTSEGILKSKYSNPKNALFEFAGEIIREAQNEDFVDYLQLFYFSNFGATPYCNIYVLPNPIFEFLNKVICKERSAWYYFVQRYYYVKGAEWDNEKKDWIQVKKNQKIVLSENEYINNKNIIYERLLAQKSILPQLLRVYREHFKNNYEKFPLMIAIHYALEVLEMSREQLMLIQKIVNTVFELSRKENNYKKYVTMLEGAGKAHQLRSALLKIIKANYLNGQKEPLIRLEEYVNYLFPDGQYWGEVRDLLLIHLYEKLHDEGVNAEEIPADTLHEIEDEEPTNII